MGEPLASIIRQSKPQTLEQAYQSVCVNQNAEARNRTAHQTKPSYHSSNSSNKNNNSNVASKPISKPPLKSAFQRSNYKIKSEVHNNQVGDDEEDVEEVEEENVDDLSCSDDDNNNDKNAKVSEQEQNFQSVRVAKLLT